MFFVLFCLYKIEHKSRVLVVSRLYILLPVHSSEMDTMRRALAMRTSLDLHAHAPSPVQAQIFSSVLT